MCVCVGGGGVINNDGTWQVRAHGPEVDGSLMNKVRTRSIKENTFYLKENILWYTKCVLLLQREHILSKRTHSMVHEVDVFLINGFQNTHTNLSYVVYQREHILSKRRHSMTHKVNKICGSRMP